MERFDGRKYYDKNNLIWADEAAEIIGCSVSAVHRRLWAGDLRGLDMGGGCHQFYKDSVVEYKKRLDEERARRGDREPGRRLYFPRHRYDQEGKQIR